MLARTALAALFALALVLAQSAGLTHRIAHGPGSDVFAERLALLMHGHEHDGDTDHVRDEGSRTTHDCAAFDAAALGDAPPLAISLDADAPQCGRSTFFSACGALANAPALGYCSRAPPRV